MAKVFSLAGQGLKLDTASDIEAHISELKDNVTIEEVEFNGNTLGVEACKALGDILRTKTTLTKVNLADIFTSRLLSEIPQALSHLLTSLLELPNLRTVNLSDNAFGLNTVAPLEPFLSQHTPLQHLILNNNGLGPAAGTLVANALLKLADAKQAARKSGKDVPALETVVCGRNRLETGSMTAWSKAYQANNHIREVKMVQNGIRQEGIVTLIRDGLSQCSALEVLDLQDNTFTSTGSRALADVLGSGKWSRLRELGVGDCLLHAKGGIIVAESLKKARATSLEVLRLQYNDINARGLATLLDAAKLKDALPNLRRVELNGNKFSEDDNAVEELREILESRRRQATQTEADDENAWGLDELDELDDDDEDEVETEEEDDSDDEEKILKEADQAEAQPVARKDDDAVGDLADELSKTELK